MSGFPCLDGDWTSECRIRRAYLGRRLGHLTHSVMQGSPSRVDDRALLQFEEPSILTMLTTKAKPRHASNRHARGAAALRSLVLSDGPIYPTLLIRQFSGKLKNVRSSRSTWILSGHPRGTRTPTADWSVSNQSHNYRPFLDQRKYKTDGRGKEGKEENVNVSPTGLPQDAEVDWPEESQWAKRCLLCIIFLLYPIPPPLTLCFMLSIYPLSNDNWSANLLFDPIWIQLHKPAYAWWWKGSPFQKGSDRCYDRSAFSNTRDSHWISHSLQRNGVLWKFSTSWHRIIIARRAK